MFFEKGWMPLVDLFQLVVRDVERIKPKPELRFGWETVDNWDAPLTKEVEDLHKAISSWSFETHTDAVRQTWEICDNLTCVAVMPLAGKPILASRQLLEWDHPSSTAGRHVDLVYGTVGSARWLDDHDEPPTQEDLNLVYGPFRGLPVVFLVKDVEQATRAARMAVLEAREMPELQKISYSPAEVARRILAAVEGGETITKATAESLFAGPMSHGQFMQAWGKATEARPDLARGGRRPRT